MAMTYQIAVVGDWDSVMGFRALGLDTYPVASVDEAKEKVRELAKTSTRPGRRNGKKARRELSFPYDPAERNALFIVHPLLGSRNGHRKSESRFVDIHIYNR